MINFWHVFLSPVAANKFIHTITSGFVLGSIFVIGISAWFILKKRDLYMAKRSILIGAVFGLISSVVLIFSGDSSTRQIVHVQPMKFAALEGLYQGREGAGLIVIGVISNADTSIEEIPITKRTLELPNFLSYMAYGKFDAFVPGVNDLINGNKERGIISSQEKIERGRYARKILADFKKAKDSGDTATYRKLKAMFYDDTFKNEYFRYFGYGFLNDTNSLIPDVPLSFYSFHLMVGLGFYFFFLFIFIIVNLFKGKLETKKGLLRLSLFTIPLAYLATMAGWMVAEVGRQPWVIQDLLPTIAAVSHINASSVQVTFWLFAFIFTALLIAELGIMFKQIKLGPKEGGN